MGLNTVPLFANLFLNYFENERINNIKKTDIGSAWLSGNIFRFTTALNGFGRSEGSFQEIYLPELELKKSFGKIISIPHDHYKR